MWKTKTVNDVQNSVWNIWNDLDPERKFRVTVVHLPSGRRWDSQGWSSPHCCIARAFCRSLRGYCKKGRQCGIIEQCDLFIRVQWFVIKYHCKSHPTVALKVLRLLYFVKDTVVPYRTTRRSARQRRTWRRFLKEQRSNYKYMRKIYRLKDQTTNRQWWRQRRSGTYPRLLSSLRSTSERTWRSMWWPGGFGGRLEMLFWFFHNIFKNYFLIKWIDK